MRKSLHLIVCIVLMASCVLPCSAASNEEVIYFKQVELSPGLLCTETITTSSMTSRSTDKSATKTQSFSYQGDTIADISITGTFRYDGNSVSVVSKKISQTNTYNGWNFSTSSFSSSGGTITLIGSLKKSFVPTIPVNFSLSCDKNGNFT